MDNYIQYFKAVLPYPVASEYTGIVDSKDYFYASSTIRPARFTQQSHVFVLSKNLLIKADIGSKTSSFINHVEIFVRSDKSWHLIKEKRPTAPLSFTTDNLKGISRQLLSEYLKGKNNDSPFMSNENIMRHIDDLIAEVFRNQYDNLASLYIHEHL